MSGDGHALRMDQISEFRTITVTFQQGSNMARGLPGMIKALAPQ
jgi:hypothetical protein